MIVGVDISTMAVHIAWLDKGKPMRWHQTLGGSKVHVIDRIRNISVAWPRSLTYDSYDTQDICIEFPYSVNRDTNAKLMAVLGAVTRQAPPWARVAWPSSGELRAAINAKNNKASAHAHVAVMFPDIWEPRWDEHSLDALVAAVGWAAILDSQQDAA